jgi:DNA uptake protein ComE-like DNA-binding protein
LDETRSAVWSPDLTPFTVVAPTPIIWLLVRLASRRAKLLLDRSLRHPADQRQARSPSASRLKYGPLVTRAPVLAACGIVILSLTLPFGAAVAANSRSGDGPLLLWLSGVKIAKEHDQQRIDINSAMLEELLAVPGVGRPQALRIIAQRPYTKLEELARAGFSSITIERLAKFLVVEPNSPSALPGPAGTPRSR